jgi:hypothetical protein
MRAFLPRAAIAALAAIGGAMAAQAAELRPTRAEPIRADWSQPNVEITYGTVANILGGAMATLEGGGDNQRIVPRGAAAAQPPRTATIVGADGDGSPVVRYQAPPASGLARAPDPARPRR